MAPLACGPLPFRVGRRGRSSVGRAPQSHCGGQGFKSPRLHQTTLRNRSPQSEKHCKTPYLAGGFIFHGLPPFAIMRRVVVGKFGGTNGPGHRQAYRFESLTHHQARHVRRWWRTLFAGHWYRGEVLDLSVHAARKRTRDGARLTVSRVPCGREDESRRMPQPPSGRRRSHRRPKKARDQARLDAASTLTFRDAASSYIDAHRAGWHNPKHIWQWGSTLTTYANPVIGDLSLQMIDTALVLKVLEPIWPTKPETASRLRGRIRRCSTGQPCAAIARETTQRAGVGT